MINQFDGTGRKRSWPTGASYLALTGGTRYKRKFLVFVNVVLDKIRCRNFVVMDAGLYCYTTNMFLCGLVFVCKLKFAHPFSLMCACVLYSYIQGVQLQVEPRCMAINHRMTLQLVVEPWHPKHKAYVS